MDIKLMDQKKKIKYLWLTAVVMAMAMIIKLNNMDKANENDYHLSIDSIAYLYYLVIN